MSDNRWTAFAAVISAASSFISIRADRSEKELHERVALLERDRDTLKKSCLDLAGVVETLEAKIEMLEGRVTTHRDNLSKHIADKLIHRPKRL